MMVVQPIVMVFLAYAVHGHASADRQFYVIFGAGMTGIWMATAFSSATDLQRERGYGTISPVLATSGSIVECHGWTSHGGIRSFAFPAVAFCSDVLCSSGDEATAIGVLGRDMSRNHCLQHWLSLSRGAVGLPLSAFPPHNCPAKFP